MNIKNDAASLLELVKKSLEADKVENITVIDLEGKTDFAYYMVIATGRSSKHITSTAEKLVDTLIKNDLVGINLEGMEKGDWVLIDAKDVIIHLFREEIRDMYDLEKIWNLTIENRA